MLKEDREFGKIKIKLDELLQERNISKNKLSYRAEVSRTQINKFLNNDVIRFDAITLCKLCQTLGCKIEDLLEYVPVEEKQEP